ncbi:MAG TPA: protein-glutamate O-methyltransferase CheR [Bryobacteraceae bacterium]|nr:protein-glutamate O-methyltransferase CheR [Bryobacteraceae bacterium]
MIKTETDIKPLTTREFEQFRKLAYEQFGLDLREGKETLVSARLGKKIRQLNFRSFQEYYRHVLEDRTGEALVALIDALTTNHTSFFREPAHFDYLGEVIQARMRDRERINIWSAACSSGEEPYSIAFCLLDRLGEEALSRVHVLATDISTRVLDRARRGAYPAERFEGVSKQQLRRYVLRGEGRWQDWYLVRPELRAMVEFRRLNLLEQFSHLGTFFAVFCRNVMIYFDKPTQQELVNRLAGCLEPGGHLLIGHSESLNAIQHQLKYVRPATYRKPESSHAKAQGGRGRR